MASTQTQASGLPPHQLSFILNQTPLQEPHSEPVHDVIANFNYYKDPGDGSPPAPVYVGKTETYEKPAAIRSAIVHDIRGTEHQYTLDKTGFQFYKHWSVEKGFVDDEHIKKVTGASKIFIFDHKIRGQCNDNHDSATKALSGPGHRVHIDQSYKAAPDRVARHLPEESEQLLKGRVQIINVWRPTETIFKDPLRVADANSVPDSDLLPVQLVYPDRISETFWVLPNEQHKWYFLYGQRPDEVTLFKCYDSKTDGRARRVPHSAFVNPATEAGKPRKSIEVRALVFHPDDTE